MVVRQTYDSCCSRLIAGESCGIPNLHVSAFNVSISANPNSSVNNKSANLGNPPLSPMDRIELVNPNAQITPKEFKDILCDFEIGCLSSSSPEEIVKQNGIGIKSTANILGDINTNKLSIEPGASFTGSCNMGSIVKGIHNEEQQEILEEVQTA